MLILFYTQLILLCVVQILIIYIHITLYTADIIIFVQVLIIMVNIILYTAGVIMCCTDADYIGTSYIDIIFRIGYFRKYLILFGITLINNFHKHVILLYQLNKLI